MSHLVCQSCWVIVFDTEALQEFWTRQRHDFSYEITWEQIALSAKQSCNWCMFLKSILPSPAALEWPSAWTLRTSLSVEISEAYIMDNASPRGLNLCQLDFASAKSSCDWHVEFDLTVDSVTDSLGIVTAGPILSKLDTPKVYPQIKQWLQQCQQHPKCSNTPKNLYKTAPSRLIEVSPATTPDVPRLICTGDLKASYLALSYCWGTGQSCVLETRNVGKLSKAIELNTLPKTIVDAIKITRLLNFAYLWIDALCIIQDSDEDKNAVIGVMDSIYEDAAITIVAASSASVADGFLQDRAVSTQAQFDLPCRLGLDEYFIAHINEHSMYDDKLEPVSKRGWTYQEALLSPRLLIYASHTLQWQCRTLTCNIGDSYHSPNPSATPRLPDPRTSAVYDSNSVFSPGLMHLESVPHSTLQLWLSIVIAYSGRNLSIPSDKLAAISALAVKYASFFGHEYYAGIWKRSPVQQLCWRSPDRRQFFTKPATYRAPSWSWAALDGIVYFPSYGQKNQGTSVCSPHPNFSIIEWKTELKASNVPYGEVKGGRLIVKTVIRNAAFDPSTSPNLLFSTMEITSVASDRDFSPPQGLPDTLEEDFARDVRCLALYIRDGTQEPLVGGLLLTQSSGQDDHSRRMGSFVADSVSFLRCPLETITIV